MAGFVGKRVHTVVAASTAVVLAGVGTAVAIRANDGTTSTGGPELTPSATSASAHVTPRPTPEKRTSAPVNPLTGRKPSDNKVVAVKVENIAAARPQIGLDAADIVFVEEVEGSLTRLVAVYHTTFPKRVGPVRSARNTDVELLPLFGEPGLVYSGANRKVQRNIDRSPIVPLQRSDRDSSRIAPHNVFVDLDAVADRAKKVGAARSIGWTFAPDDARWDEAARDSSVSAEVGGDTFAFRAQDDRYVVRWNGKTYADGRSGKPAATDNVVVMSVRNKPDGNADVNGSRSVKSATVGKGKVVIYRGGRKISGTWRRAGDTEPLRFVDADGHDIPLAVGRTWVLLSG
ncbi:MAG TPA: DUF3048 domain-containing protein [Microlunatus sp.]|nr:DUF3048 domain-containing protein [Microlunatus sp.]